MSDDTDIGGARRSFPTTRGSIVGAMMSQDPDVLRAGYGELVSAYWKPVYAHIRRRWQSSNEDAKDLTQEFFTRAMTADFFREYDPVHARFRTFLRVCLDRFLSNAVRDAARLKRGGGIQVVGLDFDAAEADYLASEPGPLDVDAGFHRDWVRTLCTLAIEDLRRTCDEAGKSVHLRLFERYDLFDGMETERPAYRDLAREYQLPLTQVTNYLAWSRREFRRAILARLRSLCGSDEEFREEARELLGVDS